MTFVQLNLIKNDGYEKHQKWLTIKIVQYSDQLPAISIYVRVCYFKNSVPEAN